MIYTQEAFEEWLTAIPEKLKAIGNFAEKNNLKLDYTLASLDTVEKWILKHYDVASDLKDEVEVLDMLALYVGETYMKYIGGEWNLEMENGKYIFHGQIVMKYEEDDDIFYRSAKALCTSSISRKKGTLISSTLKKSMERKRFL